MGIIYNSNVEEKELYSAYGLTVYGKENDYDWTIYSNRSREKCYISLRINDGTNDIINITLGNRCIFKENFDRTIDNFLYWIEKDIPSDYIIENAVFKSLTCTDSIFNHRIEMRKYREHQEEKQRKRIEEREKKERAAVDSINDYSDENGLISVFTYEKVYLIKALTETAGNVIRTADNKHMEGLLQFMESHPDNTDARIIKSGTMEEILNYIK